MSNYHNYSDEDLLWWLKPFSVSYLKNKLPVLVKWKSLVSWAINLNEKCWYNGWAFKVEDQPASPQYQLFGKSLLFYANFLPLKSNYESTANQPIFSWLVHWKQELTIQIVCSPWLLVPQSGWKICHKVSKYLCVLLYQNFNWH